MIAQIIHQLCTIQFAPERDKFKPTSIFPDINFRTNAYLILGESIESSLVENGYAYVEYKNQQGKSTIGWILLSDLQ